VLKKLFVTVAILSAVVFVSLGTSFSQLKTKKSVDSTFIKQQSISMGHLKRQMVTEIIPLVAVSYDDGYRSIVDSVLTEYHSIDSPFRVYGKSKGRSSFLGTAFVAAFRQTSTVGSGCKMGKDGWITLRNAGWEIGSHTWDHGQGHSWYDSLNALKSAPYDSLEWEVAETYKCFVDTLGWSDVVSFAYPQSFITPVYSEIVGKYFKYGMGSLGKDGDLNFGATQIYEIASSSGGRGISFGGIGYGAVYDPLTIPRLSTSTPTWATFRQDIFDLIDAWSAGIIVVAHNPIDHGLCDGDPNDALFAGGGQTWGDFISLLDTLEADGQIEVVTVKELMERVYSRPISPSANWMDWKMKDADGDGYPNGISGIPSDRQIAPRHIVGDYTLSMNSEIATDTVGVNGGDVWGLTKFSGGIGYVFKPLAVSALEPGDIVEFGAYFCVMDTTCGDLTGCSSDTTIFSIASLTPAIQGRWAIHHGVESESSLTYRNQDAGWFSWNVSINNRNYILYPRSSGQFTQWTPIFERVRITTVPDSISIAKTLAAPVTSVDFRNIDAIAMCFNVGHTSTCEDDSLYNRIGISHPWVKIRKSKQAPNW